MSLTTVPDSRMCLYTVLLGEYERLNEQPAASGSSIDRICFTDDPSLTSETWEIRLVRRTFPSDPGRSQRGLKLRPHLLLPDHDVSLYIDNSVVLRARPEEILADLLPPGTSFAAPWHSGRDTVADEFAEVMHLGFDTNVRCEEQLAHYRESDPRSLELKPIFAALLARRHHQPAVVAAMEIWWQHILRYSRRDQLSAWFAFREAGLEPTMYPLDNHESRFHRWPVAVDRDRGRAGALWGGLPDELASAQRRIEALERELAEARRWRRPVQALRSELSLPRAARLLERRASGFRGTRFEDLR